MSLLGYFISLTFILLSYSFSYFRVNSFYVRANMCDPVIARMAYNVRPQIIVHNKGTGGDGGGYVLLHTYVHNVILV